MQKGERHDVHIILNVLERRDATEKRLEPDAVCGLKQMSLKTLLGCILPQMSIRTEMLDAVKACT
jgi:hypothetical protein